MGLSSALGVGRNALAAYQAALQIVGQNIANVGTPGYTRTSPDLSAVPGANYGSGQLGLGVRLTGVRRAVNEALNARLRTATSDTQSAATQQSNLDRIEGIFNPLGDSNLGTLMEAFFGSIGDLQNSPENYATRGIVINNASLLAQKMREVRQDLVAVQDDLNTEIERTTQQANQLATQIADLNTQITAAEAGGGIASSLRDQRDILLGELSELFEITVREQPSGAVNVYVGNDALVQFGTNFGLTTANEIGSDGLTKARVQFKHNGGPVTATSGKAAGLIASRDTHFASQYARLDNLAASLIHEVNKIHAGGRGLEGFTSMTSVSGVLDADAALNTADNGLAFLPTSGSFFIDVTDKATGLVVRTQIHVDLDGIGADSTLNSVATDITNNVPGVTATVLADGRLQLTAASGTEFTFADDRSGFLACMGLNTLFTGSSSLDIAVNPLISAHPNSLAAAQSDLEGDGSNATAMASLRETGLTALGGASLAEYYTGTMAELAVSLSGATSSYEASSVIFDSLTAQRESVSGVSLDEETVAMLSYQRAFQGAAQFMVVVDEMMQTLLALVR